MLYYSLGLIWNCLKTFTPVLWFRNFQIEIVNFWWWGDFLPPSAHFDFFFSYISGTMIMDESNFSRRNLLGIVVRNVCIYKQLEISCSIRHLGVQAINWLALLYVLCIPPMKMVQLLKRFEYHFFHFYIFVMHTVGKIHPWGNAAKDKK